MTGEQQAARNAEIAKLREVALWEWEQIAAHFEIDNSTARRGYDSHLAARELDEPELRAGRNWERSSEQAMEVMKRHDIPHHMFVEIAEAMDEGINAPVPKTHLSAVVRTLERDCVPR